MPKEERLVVAFSLPSLVLSRRFRFDSVPAFATVVFRRRTPSHLAAKQQQLLQRPNFAPGGEQA